MVQERYIQHIGPEHEGQRADNFIMARLHGVPRGRVYRAFRSGEVRVNGGRIKPDYRLVAGDAVRVPPLRVSEKPAVVIPPWMQEQVRACVIQEEEQWKVLNKPAGMAVHTGSGVSSGIIEAITRMEEDEHWKLVHRLDKQTSGCLLVARQGAVLRSLAQQFRDRSVDKQYLVVVSGRWKHGSLRIDAALAKHHLEGGERMVVVDHAGMPAVTHVDPLYESAEMSVLRVRLETGRTHQIRVHLAYLGHPVLGDQKYADKQLSRRWQKQYQDSLFLHSVSLRFTIEATTVTVQSALPETWHELAIWPTIKDLEQIVTQNAVSIDPK